MLPLFIAIPLIILFVITKNIVEAHSESERHKLYGEYLALLKKVSPEKYEGLDDNDPFGAKLDSLFFDDPKEYSRLLKSEIERLTKLQ